MNIKPTSLPDVRLIELRRFADSRGYFVETWNERVFAGHGLDHHWVQDNQSLSEVAGTVRGLHYQLPPAAQTKLVRVLAGRVLDVVVDLRRGSPSFGQHAAVEMSAEMPVLLYVPTGFAHGFCTLEPGTVVSYKVDVFYAPAHERSVLWNDPSLAIAWPEIAGAAVSSKDAAAPHFAQAEHF